VVVFAIIDPVLVIVAVVVFTIIDPVIVVAIVLQLLLLLLLPWLFLQLLILF
jgi:hypothetical protein